MVKVLIYSSKEIYDTSSYEGRAEADLIAYRIDDYDYEVVKTRFTNTWVHGTGKYPFRFVKRAIERQEKLDLLHVE
jgi:hypothetical protein